MKNASALERAIHSVGGSAAFMLALDISQRTLASWRKTGVPDTRWQAVASATGGAVAAADLAQHRMQMLATQDAA